MSPSNFLFQKEMHQHMKEKAIKWHYSFTGAALNNWLEHVIKNENTTAEICIKDSRNARGRNRSVNCSDWSASNCYTLITRSADRPSDHACRISITQRTTADRKMSRNQLLWINREAESTVKEAVHTKIYMCWKRAHPQVIQDVDEIVSSSENLTDASSAVNGCRQNESPKSW